ncbi:hypothetical protein [Nocardioides sp. GXZ039]|uniref:hypothetical protein n=1 Tax=Nocardioides sp. GXZ039 TaxID=3136018 RepID=UPI0030F4A250
MSSPEIDVDQWADLDHLPHVLDDVGRQLDDTTDYAVTWMCRRDGFATSPACVLTPLAEVMDLLAAAFEGAGRRYHDDWQRRRDDVVAATAELRASDGRAQVRADAVLERVLDPAVA